MKMRKKLAALLAAAMIASVMPMTAFAASDNRVTHTVTGKTDVAITDNVPEVKIKLKDRLATDVAFYLNLTGAEWEDPLSAQTVVVERKDGNVRANISRVNDTTLRVQAQASTELKADDVIVIPLNTTLTGGEATVEVESAGTTVDNSKHVFAYASDDAASKLIVDDAKNFAGTGKAAKITLKEPFKDAFDDKSPAEREFTLELRDSDFEFDISDAEVVGTKGFHTIDGTIDYTSLDSNGDPKDKGQITIFLPITNNAPQQGEFELKDIKVKAKKGATKGDVLVVARGHLIDGSQELLVAKHSDYTTKLEMKKEYEVETGKSVDVEFTLSEEIADSLLVNRTLDFTLSEGAKFDFEEGIKVSPKSGKTGNVAGKPVKVTHDTDNYGTFELDNLILKDGEKAEYKIEATILVPNNFDGDEVLLTAEGRALSETHEIVAAKVIKAISVEVTPIDVKVGLQKQVGGKIVIKENAKEAILRTYKDAKDASKSDAEIVIEIDDNYDGLRITDADIEVTEGDLVLDLDKKNVSQGEIRIPVKRQSTKPSTIEITNIEVTANRMVPEGKYDIKVGGYALTKHSHADEFTTDKAFKDDVERAGNSTDKDYFFDSIAVAEFINITTKNPEDLQPGSGAKVVSFVIGNNKFIADGKEIEMDAAPYIKDGRTMVPLRYLATALGIDSESIKFNSGTVTIFKADGKVIQVTVGSKNLVVNGMTIPMVAAAEIIEGRTYVPVTEIGGVFGVAGTWDPATQTATFQ